MGASDSTRLVNAPSARRVVSLIAGSDLRRGTHQSAGGIQYQRIAALEHGQRRERVQPRIERAEPGRGCMQHALQRAVQARTAGGEAFAGLCQALARIVAQHGGGQIGHLALAAGGVARRGLLPGGS